MVANLHSKIGETSDTWYNQVQQFHRARSVKHGDIGV